MSTAAQRTRGADGISAQLLRDDRIIFVILVAHLPVVMFLAPLGYETDAFAIYASVLVGIGAIAGYLTLRGTPWFGRLAAVLLVTLSAILIQTQLGRSEMHFHVFLALAILFLYHRRTIIALATALVVLHHLAFTALQLHSVGLGGMPLMVFSYGCSWGIALLHLAFVLAEALVLVYYTQVLTRDQHTAELLGAGISTLAREKRLTLRIREDTDSPVVVAFNELIGDFARLTQGVVQSAREVRAVIAQLETLAHGAARDGAAQREQRTQAAAAMQTMTQSIHQVAATTRSAAELAASANERAQEGHDLFNRAVRATADLQRITSDTATAIHRLESNGKVLGAVVALVRDIAERTARLAPDTADETGVAGEIRALALATQEAAQEIQDIVRTLQIDLEDAVSRTDHGRRKTTETSSDILQAGLALNEILEAVARITELNASIATTIEQQCRVTDSVDTAILTLADQHRDLLDQAKSGLGAASRLQQVAKSLDASVAAYRR